LQNVENHSADTTTDSTTEVAAAAELDEREPTISAPSDVITDYVTQNWSDVSKLEIATYGESPPIVVWQSTGAESGAANFCTAFLPDDGRDTRADPVEINAYCRPLGTNAKHGAAREIEKVFPGKQDITIRPIAPGEYIISFAYNTDDGTGERIGCSTRAVGFDPGLVILVEDPTNCF
jgi:hypothetical protein